MNPRTNPEPGREWAPETLERALAAAGAILKSFRGLPDGPQSAWSLLSRALARSPSDAFDGRSDSDYVVGYLAKAMVSLLTDLERRRASRPVHEDVAAVDPTARGSAADLEVLTGHDREVMNDVLAELARIDVVKLHVVLFKLVEELTWDDTAKALGISVDSARGHYRFAIAWLEREFRRRGLAHED